MYIKSNNVNHKCFNNNIIFSVAFFKIKINLNLRLINTD